jgi:hypothetical protein
MGGMFGYSQRDIDVAVSWLKRVYEPSWVQANPSHPIVVSLFAPESVTNFLQVVDLGYAIATFPCVLQGKAAKRVGGDLQGSDSFYPREYWIRVLSRLNKVVDSIVLEEDIPVGPNDPRPDARIKYQGQAHDIEIFHKKWSSYAIGAFSDLYVSGKPVNSNELTLKELDRLEEETYKRLDKVDEAIPMVFICSPPPHLMVLFAMKRTAAGKAAKEIFRSVSERISAEFRAQFCKVRKLAIDMPDLVSRSHTSIPNHRDSPSEFICCENPYFIP